ncbi:hypothetical protein R83H12_00782 [Fibrobacteria bacterium R8-3-H12]
MKTLLTIAAITFLIACGTDPRDEERTTSSSSGGQTTTSSSSGQNTKNYTVTTSSGASCNVMIRKSNYSNYSYHEYTLQCPSGTKIGCMRAYDNSNFILGTRSSYITTTSFGLVAADGYGDGDIYIDPNKGNFESIVRVSLSETSCN